jgi:hypothetical protein
MHVRGRTQTPGATYGGGAGTGRKADKYVNQLLQHTLIAFDDVEVAFIGILKDDRMPPRTCAEESRVLDHTEFVLEQVAVPQLTAIQEMVAKFGPKILSVE